MRPIENSNGRLLWLCGEDDSTVSTEGLYALDAALRAALADYSYVHAVWTRCWR